MKLRGLFLIGLSIFFSACAQPKRADMILINGEIHTLDSANTVAQAFAVQGGKFLAVGNNDAILKLKGDSTLVIDAKGAIVIPGLVDDHLHVIRGGLNYNLELRWDGLTSLKRGLEMIQEQVARTPKGEWVRRGQQFKRSLLQTNLRDGAANRKILTGGGSIQPKLNANPKRLRMLCLITN